MPHSPPLSRSGWDGKLRIGEMNGDDNDSNASSEAEDAILDEQAERRPIVQQGEVVEGQQIEADEDLLADYDEDVEEIELSHSRISSLERLGLSRFTKVSRLGFRQNMILDLELPESLAETVEDLDLYDNLIKEIRGLDKFTKLKSLDLSFNKVKHIKNLNHLTQLKDLYFVQDRISKIEGLEGLTSLRNLELGGNRVRTVENLETLTALEELWLGKNKITQITGLSTLTNLTILSIQANRIREISGLESLTSLEELHISHNALTRVSGLETNTNLRVIDISQNPISQLEGLETLAKLEELWASSCQLDSFDNVEKQLRDKSELKTVYFEANPLQLRQPVLYRNKVRLALPQVQQIDATFVTNPGAR